MTKEPTFFGTPFHDKDLDWPLPAPPTSLVVSPEVFAAIQGNYQADRYATRRQLLRWANGQSVHHEITGECTPDKSCCGSPEWDPKLKRTLLKAHRV